MSPHRSVFVEFVQQQKWHRGAELGIDKGILFNMLLTGCPSLSLIGVDTGVVPKRVAHCHAVLDDFSDRAVIHWMRTHEAARLVEDRSLDFVFIDADHADRSVTEDIADWTPKVRSGGWVGGHDYNLKFPGVMAAVDRAFGKRVRTWPGSIWGVWQ